MTPRLAGAVPNLPLSNAGGAYRYICKRQDTSYLDDDPVEKGYAEV